MSRFALLSLIATSLLGHASALAQASAPTAKPAMTPGAAPNELVNSLNAADVQAALNVFKSNFAEPDATVDTELSRSTLEGLLVRHPRGLMIVAGQGEMPVPEAPLYAEILQGHVGYLRLGALTNSNLKAMDRKLSEFGSKKVDALIVDLRASSRQTDFSIAAEFGKRFCPKGKTLFILRKTAMHQDRNFDSDRDPSIQGLLVVLVDGDTAGGAEAVGAALRAYDRALIIGQPTAGRAAEYSDFPLSDGKTIRVASAEAVSPDGHVLFPSGVKPDLAVEMLLSEKRQIFQLSAEKGMASFIYEAERPHLNEAALLAGTNPELDGDEAQRRAGGRSKLPPRDSVLQRALDVLTSVEIYQKH